MKTYLSLVKKEFHHILRDKRTMLILFGIPVALMLLFGFVITNEIKTIGIAVLDQSNDYTTNQIVDRLESSCYFVVKQRISNYGQLESVFKSGAAKLAIVFEQQFDYNLQRNRKANVQIIADASDANFANLSVSYATAVIRGYINDKNVQKSGMLQIVPEVRMAYNPELKGVYFFVPGIMALILMLISALMTSVSIVREKEYGSMDVLLVSPVRPVEILLGKVTPYILLSFINAFVIVVLGWSVFGLPVAGSLFLLFFECFLFISLALSLGILISTIADSQMVAMFVSAVGLMLPTILLSGFIFPIENMPLILQWFCNIMPPKYFIIILKHIMLMGNGLKEVWKETLILLSMNLFFILLAIKKFKIRR
ncbi:MAG TPA: ABC transporter permease [Bacteroidales bacterium]|nr:ABC transporter permease [Bacteroidales bacterium]